MSVTNEPQETLPGISRQGEEALERANFFNVNSG